MGADLDGAAQNNGKYPQSSRPLRFLAGCVLTTAITAISLAIAVWLGTLLVNLFPRNDFVFSLGVWWGTSVLFILNFLRPRVERAIIHDFEESMLFSEDTEAEQN